MSAETTEPVKTSASQRGLEKLKRFIGLLSGISGAASALILLGCILVVILSRSFTADQKSVLALLAFGILFLLVVLVAGRSDPRALLFFSKILDWLSGAAFVLVASRLSLDLWMQGITRWIASLVDDDGGGDENDDDDPLAADLMEQGRGDKAFVDDARDYYYRNMDRLPHTLDDILVYGTVWFKHLGWVGVTADHPLAKILTKGSAQAHPIGYADLPTPMQDSPLLFFSVAMIEEAARCLDGVLWPDRASPPPAQQKMD